MEHLQNIDVYLDYVTRQYGLAGRFAKSFSDHFADWTSKRQLAGIPTKGKPPRVAAAAFEAGQKTFLRAQRGATAVDSRDELLAFDGVQLQNLIMAAGQESPLSGLSLKRGLTSEDSSPAGQGSPRDGLSLERGFTSEDNASAGPDTNAEADHDLTSVLEIESNDDGAAVGKKPPVWLTAATAAANSASKSDSCVLWRRIVDLDDKRVVAALGKETADHINQAFTSATKGYQEPWTVLSPTATLCLRRMLNIKLSDLAEVARNGPDEGRKWMFYKLKEAAALIDKGVTTCCLGERDGDIHCHGEFFSAAASRGIRMHYGEVESRASRTRRANTEQQATGKTTPCGARCDFLFTSDEINTDSGWGLEWGAAASIGMRRDLRTKVIHDKAGLISLLRDMHVLLTEKMPAVAEDRDKIVERMHISGTILHNWTAAHYLVAHIGRGFYAAKLIDRTQIPTCLDENFANFFANTMRCFLRFRDGIRWTHDLFLHGSQPDWKSDDDSSSADSNDPQPHEAYLHPRTPKKKQSK
ncbi:hypothetical protein BDZ88DRAFT_455136 [Geranomyces variabilis]|nr:hypothetical protein BDZ88DRAFT_455136 [Geranomyces variabilis]KAJ3132206.1 hypothetical protein HDU90_007512 [Geranomyces variabilis]